MNAGKGSLRKKGLRDLFLDKGRTLIVILAVFVGVFGSSMVLTSYGILKRNIKPNYRRTNPPSLVVETTPLGASVVEDLKKLEGMEGLERRGRVQGRLQLADGSYLPLILFIVDDFAKVNITRFFPEEGAWPPEENGILIERLALPLSGYGIGESVPVIVPGKSIQNLVVSGTVHDPGQAPAWMEGLAYGYISRDEASKLGWVSDTESYHITVDFDIFDKERITSLSGNVQAIIEGSGASLLSLVLPEPDVHPHEKQMLSLQLIQVSFGLLALILSSIISATMISAFLEGQIRQIAILKTIGGTRIRLVRHYLSVIAVPVGSALALGIPLGIFLGGRFSGFFAGLLNFNIMIPGPPPLNLLFQLVLGFLLPLGTALIPILKGCAMTAREALAYYGISPVSGKKERKGSRKLVRLRLALSGMLRKRGRFILTVLTLSMGGMLFITALNVRESMSGTVVNQFARQKQDGFFVLNEGQSREALDAAVESVSLVKEAEYWIRTQVPVAHSDGVSVDKIDLWAVPDESSFFKEIIHEGSWSPDMGERGIAVNEVLLESVPGFGLGQQVELNTPMGKQTFTVTAVLRQPMVPSRMYVPLKQYAGDTNRYNMVQVEGNLKRKKSSGFQGHFNSGSSGRNISEVDRLMESMDLALSRAGMDVVVSYQVAEMEKIAKDHMQMASFFLLLLSILSLLLGAMSLTMTLRLNIRDQKRETAVLKAVGAGRKILSKLIRRQALFTVGISWLVSIIAAWPVSLFIANFFGQTFFETNLDFVYAHPGPVLWGGLSVLLALFAAWKPIREVLSISVTQTLRYE